MRYTGAEIASHSGGQLLRDGPAGPLVTDSRALASGDWFLALVGERFDGHAFLDKARAAGCAGAVVSGDAPVDWDRGLVLGTPTVGKGSVQQTVSIGDRAELKLTMAAYFIPSGRSIDKRMRNAQAEIESRGMYRHVVINDDLTEAIDRFVAILKGPID